MRETNRRWTAALTDHLVRSGVRRARASRLVTVLDAAFMGFQLDLPLDRDQETRQRAVADLADAVASREAGRTTGARS